VRVTVNNDAAAQAVPEMLRKLRDLGVGVPVIGDFHYNGHQLLVEYPEMARGLAKYRINPGNVGAEAARRELPDDRPRRHRERVPVESASTGARSTRRS
jgi:4-hydroxy-3-methylbut-2-en-1-yl diphosphate synthase IspG/GcpE